MERKTTRRRTSGPEPKPLPPPTATDVPGLVYAAVAGANERERLFMWRETVRFARVGDEWEQGVVGPMHAAILMPIPVWLAKWILRRRYGVSV